MMSPLAAALWGMSPCVLMCCSCRFVGADQGNSCVCDSLPPLCAGAGVQGTTVRHNQKRAVRFGSVEYAVEALPPAQAAAVSESAGGLMHDSVVSLLVDTPAEHGRGDASTSGNGAGSENLVRSGPALVLQATMSPVLVITMVHDKANTSLWIGAQCLYTRGISSNQPYVAGIM